MENGSLEVQSERLPVPFDHVMIATFCLTALNGVSGRKNLVDVGRPSTAVTPTTRSVSAPPRLTTADDLFSFVARLRFVMEDPTQLLSGSVASYVLGQLALGKQPADVAIPG